MPFASTSPFDINYGHKIAFQRCEGICTLIILFYFHLNATTHLPAFKF